MTTTNKGKFQSVRAGNGMMLTNGETFSEEIFTPLNTDLSAWREITIEEAERLQQELLAKQEATPMDGN